MHFSKKILSASLKPKFRGHKTKEERIMIELAHLSCQIEISYQLLKKQELIVSSCGYETSLSGPYLGVLDLYFELIQNKLLDALKRINAKELDYYCRDSKEQASVSYYAQEWYEILSVGEKIYDFHQKKKDKVVLFSPEVDGDFWELSFSEQVEYFEEFCSCYIYPDPEYKEVILEVLDIKENKIEISLKGAFFKNKKQLEQIFNQAFFIQSEWVIH